LWSAAAPASLTQSSARKIRNHCRPCCLDQGPWAPYHRDTCLFLPTAIAMAATPPPPDALGTSRRRPWLPPSRLGLLFSTAAAMEASFSCRIQECTSS
jgi:hypothetical protein